MNDFKHKKSLGQNFLHDESVLKKIKDSIDIKSNDLIIEIGPGKGALTKYLKEFGCKVICFEIDERVKEFLDYYVDEKTSIIYGDFLKVNVNDVLDSYKYDNLYVVANLPYYITTPIITKFIDDKINVKEMVLMVQNEVADRFTSKPGSSNYGSISVFLNYYFDVSKLFFVHRKSFTPIPNVDSAVIKLSSKFTEGVLDENVFFSLIRDSFVHKRKNIKNNLYNYNLDILNEVLLSHGFDLTVRAEQLSIEVFIDIANRLGSK